MKFKIIHEAKGRIRVRCARNYFDKQTGYALEEILLENSFIKSAEASYINGGILIYYRYGFRENVIEVLNGINIKDVVPIKESKNGKDSETKSVFQRKIMSMAVKRVFFKYFLPAPIGNAVTLLRGLSYLKCGLRNLAKCKINVEVLDAASISAAIASSDFKTANSIMFLLSLSEVIEEYTMDKARNSLADSLSLNIDKVWLVTESGEINVPLKDVRAGDKVRVRSGSLIPVDGVIEKGEAFINESSMTGESSPVMKGEGKTVYAGTVIDEGSVIIKVNAVENETRLSKIINLIDESENYKAEIHSKAMRLADNIVPFSFLTSIGTYLITRNITKALSVLMVDYSCAIKLSTPICVAAAMSEAAKNGIVVKGGKFLEIFSHADVFVFDKTGTLTIAEPAVKKIETLNGFSEEYVLKTAACLEEHFPHSVAKAIVKEAADRGLIHDEEHAEVEYIVAHGIASKIGDTKVIIGSGHFVFDDEKIFISDEEKKFIEEKSKGYSAIFLAVGSKLAGFICIDDPLRDEAAEVVNKLKEDGIKIYMLTGDGEYAAKKVCGKLGISNYKFGVLPEDKSETVNYLKNKGKKVVMVGDGINDTPALAAADVSVSMKDSSDIAREVSDVIIMSENLHKLIIVRQISKGMMKKINSNYKFILGFNTALLFLGIGGFIQPSTSAFMHNFSTMLIGSLSMRNCAGKNKR